MAKFSAFVILISLCSGFVAGKALPTDQEVAVMLGDQEMQNYMSRYLEKLTSKIKTENDLEVELPIIKPSDLVRLLIDRQIEKETEINLGESGTDPLVDGQIVKLVVEFEDDKDESYEVAPEEMSIENVTVESEECPEWKDFKPECDVNAKCILSAFDPRGYTCSCLEDLVDISSDPSRPGQVCSDEEHQCAGFCSNGGICEMRDGVPTCRCINYFSGARCTVSSFVLFTVFICLFGGLVVALLVLTCCRSISTICNTLRGHNGNEKLAEDRFVIYSYPTCGTHLWTKLMRR